MLTWKPGVSGMVQLSTTSNWLGCVRVILTCSWSNALSRTLSHKQRLISWYYRKTFLMNSFRKGVNSKFTVRSYTKVAAESLTAQINSTSKLAIRWDAIMKILIHYRNLKRKQTCSVMGCNMRSSEWHQKHHSNPHVTIPLNPQFRFCYAAYNSPKFNGFINCTL
jgi:hypothetical protein